MKTIDVIPDYPLDMVFGLGDIVKMIPGTGYDSLSKYDTYKVINTNENNGRQLIRVDLYEHDNRYARPYGSPSANWLKASNFQLISRGTASLLRIEQAKMTGNEYLIVNKKTGTIAKVSSAENIQNDVNELLKGNLTAEFIIFQPKSIAKIKEFPVSYEAIE